MSLLERLQADLNAVSFEVARRRFAIAQAEQRAVTARVEANRLLHEYETFEADAERQAELISVQILAARAASSEAEENAPRPEKTAAECADAVTPPPEVSTPKPETEAT